MVNAVVVSGRWQEWAACKGMDTNIFFPWREDGPDSRLARETCETCIVRDYCLAESNEREDEYGIFGGMGGRERRGKRPPIPLSQIGYRAGDAPCGTTAGYARHRRRGQKPCRDCVNAETARSNERNSRKRVNDGGIAAAC